MDTRDHAAPDQVRAHAKEFVETLLRDRGWSAARLAREIGVSPSTITRILNPKANFVPASTTMQKLAGMVAADYAAWVDQETSKTLSSQRRMSVDVRASSGLLPVLGYIKYGNWLPFSVVQSRSDEFTGMWDSMWKGEVVVYKISDDDSDSVYGEGTLVFARPVDSARDMTVGRVYIIRRRGNLYGRQVAETALWQMAGPDDDPRLISRARGTDEFLDVGGPPDARHDVLGEVVGFYASMPC